MKYIFFCLFFFPFNFNDSCKITTVTMHTYLILMRVIYWQAYYMFIIMLVSTYFTKDHFNVKVNFSSSRSNIYIYSKVGRLCKMLSCYEIETTVECKLHSKIANLLKAGNEIGLSFINKKKRKKKEKKAIPFCGIKFYIYFSK